MVVPLVILAILSLIGGYIGVPHALGGGNRFEAFLAPVFERYTPVHATAERRAQAETGAGTAAVPRYQQNAEAATATETNPRLSKNAAAEREGAGPDQSEVNMERLMTAISVALAFLGLFLAYWFYYADPTRADRAAQKMRGLYRLIWHKYWVDEVYGAIFVRPILRGSTDVLWRTIDVGTIDATVNGAGHTASGLSSVARRMQSGNIRAYAAWIAAGAAGVIAYMIYLGVNR
jgi:NADH-quinone oxidoreductase subunit L